MDLSPPPSADPPVPLAAGDEVTLNLLPDQFDVSLGTRFGARQMQRRVSKEFLGQYVFQRIPVLFQFLYALIDSAAEKVSSLRDRPMPGLKLQPTLRPEN